MGSVECDVKTIKCLAYQTHQTADLVLIIATNSQYRFVVLCSHTLNLSMLILRAKTLSC
jgi:hypothetical protein